MASLFKIYSIANDCLREIFKLIIDFDGMLYRAPVRSIDKCVIQVKQLPSELFRIVFA